MAGDGPDDDGAVAGKLGRLNTGVPHGARVYDALLGGKDNFTPDREVAQAIIKAFPAVVESVHANRAFLERAVTYLVNEAGIRQFLDIGTGLPSANNTHEVAQRHAPEARVLYVDNDPLVLVHAQALLTSTEPGWTGYLDADLREPQKIIERAASVLDLSRPVAVMLIGMLHFLADEDNPHRVVSTLMDAVPSGSYLVMTHISSDLDPGMIASMRIYNESAVEKSHLRDRAECARFFDGLELVEPGLVQWNKWRPRTPAEADAYGGGWSGVARKPLCADGTGWRGIASAWAVVSRIITPWRGRPLVIPRSLPLSLPTAGSNRQLWGVFIDWSAAGAVNVTRRARGPLVIPRSLPQDFRE